MDNRHVINVREVTVKITDMLADISGCIYVPDGGLTIESKIGEVLGRM